MNDQHIETAETSRYLEFRLGDEIYAIPLLVVREVISIPETTAIPQAPSYFEGIMNLRGQIISILDLRKKLKIVSEEPSKEEAVIILDFQDFRVGVIVDEISKVLTVENKDLRDVPVVKSKVSAEYIDAVFEKGDELIVIVDIIKALDVSDIAFLKQEESA